MPPSLQRWFSIWLLCVNAILVAACTHTLPGAEGIPKDQLAVLSNKFPPHLPYVFVVEVDGKPRPYGSYSTYELPPGHHVVTVMGNEKLGLVPTTVRLAFDAKPGKKYELRYERLSPTYRWRAWLIDEETSETVASQSVR